MLEIGESRGYVEKVHIADGEAVKVHHLPAGAQNKHETR